MSRASPSLPTLPSSSPHPPGSFWDAQGGAAWAGVGEAAHGGGGGVLSKRHLGPDPHLGAFDNAPAKELFTVVVSVGQERKSSLT